MRAPEMNVFPSRTITLRSVDHPEGVIAYTVPADWADAAIRSLRVKLFKERAMTHALNAEHFETRRNHKRTARHRRAHSRFAILAELIRAGER